MEASLEESEDESPAEEAGAWQAQSKAKQGRSKRGRRISIGPYSIRFSLAFVENGMIVQEKIMIGITVREFKKNLARYIKMAENERIEVTRSGDTIFVMIPKREELGEKLSPFFGCLPADATIGEDPYERG